MINEKMRRAREERYWSIQEAARRIGVDRVTYSRWERGEQLPRGSTLQMICDAFKMTAEQLALGYSSSTSSINSLTEIRSVQPSMAHVETAIDIFSTGVLALTLARHQYGWSFAELQTRIEQEIRRIDAMSHQQGQEEGKLSRREVIGLLVSTPAAAFGIMQTGDVSLNDDEIVSLCSVNVPLAWRLYFAGGINEVRQSLPYYTTKLSTLAKQPSRFQNHAAGLASQAHQLGYLLALQGQDFSVAQSHAGQALQYAEIANDSNLRVASLVRQGNLFFSLKRPLQTMQKYQEAIQRSSNASPLITGQAYIGLAEAQARLGRKEEAEQMLGLALDTFPEHPENDLHFAYTHFNHFTRINFEGLMYLHLNQPKKAWETFAQIDKDVPLSLVPQRVELLSRQALTSVALGDLEQSCSYVELALTSALKIGSDLRYNEVCETYLQMQFKWPHEQRVKELADLFVK